MQENKVIEFKSKDLAGPTTPQSYRTKELISCHSIVVVSRDNPSDIHEVGKVRCYMGRSNNASVVYATVSIHFGEYHANGYGKAGGGGYHKPSAAIGDALRCAGIELLNPIDGRGESAIEAALYSIASYIAPNWYAYIVQA